MAENALEHDLLERMHPDMQALLAWQGDAPPPIGAGERALVDAFVAAYESHMALEESVAYPAARPLFGDGELQRIGDEMASRRRQDTRR